MRYLFWIGILWAASACQQQAYVTDAPTIPSYTPAQEQRAKQDFNALPPDSPLRVMLRDCRFVREELRAE